MWTPRRILFLFAGLAAFLAIYVGYALFLGGIDGLPVLPEKFLKTGEGEFRDLIVTRQSPVELRIEQAFGAKCRELEDSAYKTKVEHREKGLVFAAGALPDIKEPTKKVLVSPLSLAIFFKPASDAAPNEVPEIVTIHSDEAILEFDKAITSRTEILSGAAKLVGVELIGNPDADFQDVRKGLVYITHNQKSDDPSRRLIVRSPGPVFYTAFDSSKSPKSDVPTVRTSAKVEVENRANAPRPLWGQRFPAVVATGDDLRASNAISDIVLGRRAPPTTVSAIGLKMYFAQENEPAKPGQKAGSSQQKLREIQLGEAVQFNLWLESSSGFPGTNSTSSSSTSSSSTSSSSTSAKKVVEKDPNIALAAVAGTLVGGKAVHDKLRETSLLSIETRGPFRFNVESNVAHFDIAPTAPPNQSNNVEVVRISASGTRDTLISQKLEIGFEKGDSAPASKTKANSDSALGGSGLRSVIASGPYVRLDSETDQLIAQGTMLHYEMDRKTGKTTLNFKGSPIDAVKDRHRLKVGERGLVAELQYVSVPGKPGPKGQPTNETTLVIRGPGGIAFYDPNTRENNTTATWATSLTQVREMVGDKNLDKYTFDSGRFNDAKAGFDLVGNVINLWVDPSDPGEGKAGDARPGMTQAVPYRLQALQNVSLKSPELVIDETDSLSVWFRQADRAAPKPPDLAIAPAPAPGAGTVATIPPPGGAIDGALPLNPVPPAGPPQPAPPPNPLRLSARTVEAWCARMPPSGLEPVKPVAQKAAGANDANDPPQPKYELERAICTDRVDAHQAPADPKKNPRGLDLRAAKLTLERQVLKDQVGFSLHLLAMNGDVAELHYEDTSIAGPDIKIDQLANYLRVIGAGALKMPANGGLTSVAVAPQSGVVRASATQPAIASPASAPAPAPTSTSDMNVEWSESMEFKGADGVALFVGKVQAKQETTPILANLPAATEEPIWEKSFVLCHRLQIAFDRPIYFNQLKDRKPADAEGGPKVARAICKPAPVDDAGIRARTDGMVLFENEQRRRDRSVVKRERVRSPNLDFRAGERGGGTLVCGGPGEVRILQYGSKEQQRPGQAGAAAQGKPAPANAGEQEMKLTLVTYRTRLTMEDQGQAFQKAVFEGDAVAYHVPTTDFERLFEVYSPLPERSTMLKADESLTVSTYKPQTGKLEQKLDAIGNANFRTDEYHGRAHRITFDGRTMTLDATGSRLALIEPARPRVGDGVPMSARRIEYDTVDNRTRIVEGASGSLSPR